MDLVACSVHIRMYAERITQSMKIQVHCVEIWLMEERDSADQKYTLKQTTPYSEISFLSQLAARIFSWI